MTSSHQPASPDEPTPAHPGYGSLAWARRTGGRLGRAERVRQGALLARARVLARLRSGAALLPGLEDREQARRAVAGIRPPDTPAVRAAAEAVDAALAPAMAAHSWRTYVFARLFALRNGTAVDEEVLALAALLHDVALGSRRDHSRECFAHDGAEQALALVTAHGVDAARAHRIADAVCLHLRVEVPEECGREAHLVNAGSALDVVGARLREVPPEAVRAVLERYPRADLAAVLVALLEDERHRHPAGRAAHWTRLGFGRLVAAHPADRGPTGHAGVSRNGR